MEEMKKYRFVPKRYGWGFVPVSRQGRLFTIGLLSAVLIAARRNGMFVDTAEDPTLLQAASFVLDMWIIIFAALRFMDTKTRGDLKWRWGDED